MHTPMGTMHARMSQSRTEVVISFSLFHKFHLLRTHEAVLVAVAMVSTEFKVSVAPYKDTICSP